MNKDKISKLKEEIKILKKENKTLRNTKLYQRLLNFEKNIQIKKYSIEDLGF